MIRATWRHFVAIAAFGVFIELALDDRVQAELFLSLLAVIVREELRDHFAVQGGLSRNEERLGQVSFVDAKISLITTRTGRRNLV